MFGHGFKIFFKDVFAKHADTFAELKVQPNQGMSDLESKIAGHAKEADFLAYKQWDRNGDAVECVAVVPDSTYAMFHAEMVADCVANGQYDVTTMGTMQNIGLMAQKAEEYGSHPTIPILNQTTT